MWAMWQREGCRDLLKSNADGIKGSIPGRSVLHGLFLVLVFRRSPRSGRQHRKLPVRMFQPSLMEVFYRGYYEGDCGWSQLCRLVVCWLVSRKAQVRPYFSTVEPGVPRDGTWEHRNDERHRQQDIGIGQACLEGGRSAFQRVSEHVCLSACRWPTCRDGLLWNANNSRPTAGCPFHTGVCRNCSRKSSP